VLRPNWLHSTHMETTVQTRLYTCEQLTCHNQPTAGDMLLIKNATLKLDSTQQMVVDGYTSACLTIYGLDMIWTFDPSISKSHQFTCVSKCTKIGNWVIFSKWLMKNRVHKLSGCTIIIIIIITIHMDGYRDNHET